MVEGAMFLNVAIYVVLPLSAKHFIIIIGH